MFWSFALVKYCLLKPSACWSLLVVHHIHYHLILIDLSANLTRDKFVCLVQKYTDSNRVLTVVDKLVLKCLWWEHGEMNMFTSTTSLTFTQIRVPILFLSTREVTCLFRPDCWELSDSFCQRLRRLLFRSAWVKERV